MFLPSIIFARVLYEYIFHSTPSNNAFKFTQFKTIFPFSRYSVKLGHKILPWGTPTLNCMSELQRPSTNYHVIIETNLFRNYSSPINIYSAIIPLYISIISVEHRVTPSNVYHLPDRDRPISAIIYEGTPTLNATLAASFVNGTLWLGAVDTARN